MTERLKELYPALTAAQLDLFHRGFEHLDADVRLVKDMIDDMHSWYHRKKMRTASRNQIGAIHIYDSIAVIEKRQVARPRHIEVQ